MSGSISREFRFGSLLRFALPTIVMMIFMSLYTIVDGFFVSRFVGTNGLSAINIIWPLLNIVVAIAIMFGTGGSAIVARQMGEGLFDDARRNFTTIAITATTLGVAIAVITLLFLSPIVHLLGASEVLVPFCEAYLGTLVFFAPFGILQMLFQVFFVAAGKPHFGLILSIGAGIVNAVLDYVLVVPAGLGIRGAALATAIGWMIPSIAGLLYFLKGKNELHFVKPRFDGLMLRQACFNGSSEMVVNLSNGVTTFLFNMLLMRYAGEDGVAAITIIMYIQFLFLGLYQGFSDGIAPVVSYNYGSGNTAQLKRIFRIAITFLCASALILVVLAQLGSSGLIRIFAQPDSAAFALAKRGFTIYALNFLVCGLNIFCSAFFTALSNGPVSAAISFLRTFLFLVGSLLLLPGFLGETGIWLAVPVAELLTLAFSLFFFFWGRKRYHYGETKTKKPVNTG